MSIIEIGNPIVAGVSTGAGVFTTLTIENIDVSDDADLEEANIDVARITQDEMIVTADGAIAAGDLVVLTAVSSAGAYTGIDASTGNSDNLLGPPAGIAKAAIADTVSGAIITRGLVRMRKPSAQTWAVGTVIYAVLTSATTSSKWDLATAVDSAKTTVPIGVVLRAHNANNYDVQVDLSLTNRGGREA